MRVHTEIKPDPSFQNGVVTIGTFDGVHLGHRQIIERLKKEAAETNRQTVIITFHPHPRKIVGSGTLQVPLITTTDEKIRLLQNLEIDHMVVVPFTETFANQTAEQYVEDFLIRQFQPHTLIIGYDHRFGKGRKGDFHLLEDYSAELGFKLLEIPQHLLNEISISSTRIREALINGHVSEANALLGYRFFFEGVVVEGNKLGRTLGFPTANLEITDPEKLVPGNGVYAVTAEELPLAPGRPVLRGMMNIGVRPTIGGTKRVIEVHLFDFAADIYGKKLQVEVREFIRGEQKFTGLEALKDQLLRDKTHAASILSGTNSV